MYNKKNLFRISLIDFWQTSQTLSRISVSTQAKNDNDMLMKFFIVSSFCIYIKIRVRELPTPDTDTRNHHHKSLTLRTRIVGTLKYSDNTLVALLMRFFIIIIIYRF